MNDIFAPAGGWRVRILDLSGGAEDGIVEEIGGFPTLMQANEFARRYVRDSLEHCRAAGMDAAAVIAAWSAYGEDAEVLGGEDGWRSAPDLQAMAAQPATPDSRNWRALDPRRLRPDDDDNDAEGDGA